MTYADQLSATRRRTDLLADAAASVEDLMSIIVGRLQERPPHFDWVGFYMIEEGRLGEDPMLVLGPYVGAETPQQTQFPSTRASVAPLVSTGQTVVA